MQCQTEQTVSKSAITQTNTVEYNDEDCQTDGVQTLSIEVQVGCTPTVECGTEPDQEILEQAASDLEE